MEDNTYFDLFKLRVFNQGLKDLLGVIFINYFKLDIMLLKINR